MEVGMPFWAKRDLSVAMCPGCSAQIRCDVPSYATTKPQLWPSASEKMQPARDYDLIVSSNTKIREPTVLFWLWTPLPSGCEFDDAMTAAVGRELMNWQDHRRIAVVGPDWNNKIDGFNEVLRLRRHVMQGATGPYPSIRAEKSLTRTFDPRKMIHYWPAATLPAAGYREIVGWQELAKTWARESRRGLKVTATGV
jgi:hypothetical protein